MRNERWVEKKRGKMEVKRAFQEDVERQSKHRPEASAALRSSRNVAGTVVATGRRRGHLNEVLTDVGQAKKRQTKKSWQCQAAIFNFKCGRERQRER